MNFARLQFNTALIASITIHIVILSLLISPFEHEKKPIHFDPIYIKLSSKKFKRPTPTSVAVNIAQNTPAIPRQTVPVTTTPKLVKAPKNITSPPKTPAKKKQATKITPQKKNDSAQANIKKRAQAELKQTPQPALLKSIAQIPTKIIMPKQQYKTIPSTENSISSKAPIDPYEVRLPKWFSDFAKYPEQARAMGLKGRGVVGVMINRDGKVLSYKLAKSTGHPILDKALIKMIKDAKYALPVPPDYMVGKKTFSFLFPYDFSKHIE